MRRFKTLIALVTIVVISALAAGCMAGLKSLTRAPKKAETSTQPGTLAKPKPPGDSDAAGDKPADGYPPVYAPPPPPPSAETKARTAFDLRRKDEVETSAMDFAKNFSGVQHVKICYSKLYGGWYLFLYVEKNKKRSVHHYAWKERSSEWEIIEVFKEDRIPQWKYHLKGELPGETCFLLK